VPLSHLLQRNRDWAERTRAQDQEFFAKLAEQQAPQYLWIGCSDSRVPANQIVGLMPGEVFVHRNIANVVTHSDLNCLSVVQYAVEVLGVRHIIVCGHYGCGGVKAALDRPGLGMIDNWLRHVEDVADEHRAELEALEGEQARHDRLCELNAMAQALSVAGTSFVREAWAAGKALSVHSWIYGIQDGLLRNLGMTLTAQADVVAAQAAPPLESPQQP